MRDYVAIFESESCVRMPEGQSLGVRFEEAPAREFLFSNMTLNTGTSGSDFAGLCVEVRGNANNLEEGARESYNVANSLLSALSLAANAAIGDPHLEAAYDATPSSNDHEFVQRLNPAPIEMTGRTIPVDVAHQVLATLGVCPEFPRLMRATTQYRLALSHELPGSELLASAHIWMAVEALTKAVLREKSNDAGGEDRLCAELGIGKRQLDGEIRRRYIFAGDTETYSALRRISDGFEHGFEDFGLLYAKAVPIVESALAYVRKAILSALDLPSEALHVLTSGTFEKPTSRTPLIRQVELLLRGPADGLAHPGLRHPHLRVTNMERESISATDDGHLAVEETLEVDAVVGRNIAVEFRSLTVLGSKSMDERPVDGDRYSPA